jgi:hypothetical protein
MVKEFNFGLPHFSGTFSLSRLAYARNSLVYWLALTAPPHLQVHSQIYSYSHNTTTNIPLCSSPKGQSSVTLSPGDSDTAASVLITALSRIANDHLRPSPARKPSSRTADLPHLRSNITANHYLPVNNSEDTTSHCDLFKVIGPPNSSYFARFRPLRRLQYRSES